MLKSFRVMNDRILVEYIEPVRKTEGGIHIPDNVRIQDVQRGKVVVKGSGRILSTGEILPLSVIPDDVVIYGPYAGTEIRISGKRFMLLREEDVLAVETGSEDQNAETGSEDQN